MTQKLAERVEAYLDGTLSNEAAYHFEQDLVRPEVGSAFSEALLLRDLLSEIPPEAPPPGLTARIESALNLDSVSASKTVRPSKNQLGRSIDTIKWGFRWPRFAMAGLSGTTHGLRRSLSGLNTMGYALGPLQAPSRKGLGALLKPKKSLWTIALSHLW